MQRTILQNASKPPSHEETTGPSAPTDMVKPQNKKIHPISAKWQQNVNKLAFVRVENIMAKNEVSNVGLYHRLRMAATGSLLLSLVVAMIVLGLQVPDSTGSEDLLSSSLSTPLKNPKVTSKAVLKANNNIKLDRSKKALKSLEVLAASHRTVSISIFSLSLTPSTLLG
jgi:hypothetical protein